MTDTKISALPNASTPLAGTEVLPIVQSGATVKVSISDLTVGRAINATAVTMSTGNLIPSTAAKGINFTANSANAGMTSQLLNWYEEGQVTVALVPVSSGTITMGANTTMRYVRIGRQVTVQGLINVSSVSSPVGALTVTGMPFTSAAGGGYQGSISVLATGLSATAITQISGITNANSTVLTIYKYAAGGVTNLAGDVIASSTFYITATYFV